MQEKLWSWLEQRGYSVTGEITLGNSGRIDLLAYDEDEDKFLGIEIKNHNKIQNLAPYNIDGSKENRRELALQSHWQQLNGYQESEYLDELYFASQEPESIFEVTEESRTYASQAHDISPVTALYSNSDYAPDQVGTIKLPDMYESSSPTIVQEATTISRTKTPHFPRDNESWVQHYVWEETGTIREGILPNTDSGYPKRIDIAAFSGSSDPTTVYENQPEDDIIGIEAKGAGAVQRSATKITDQLTDYLNSGALTRVYLAVPEADTSDALELLSKDPDALDEVGLYTVDTMGHVTEEKIADRQTLRHDGLRTKEGKNVDIIWGYGREESDKDKVRYSVYDLTGGIMEQLPY